MVVRDDREIESEGESHEDSMLPLKDNDEDGVTIRWKGRHLWLGAL